MTMMTETTMTISMMTKMTTTIMTRMTIVSNWLCWLKGQSHKATICFCLQEQSGHHTRPLTADKNKDSKRRTTTTAEATTITLCCGFYNVCVLFGLVLLTTDPNTHHRIPHCRCRRQKTFFVCLLFAVVCLLISCLCWSSLLFVWLLLFVVDCC